MSQISLAMIFWLFVKFGILCFGGGYMLIPLLTADLVVNYGLISEQQFINLVSIAQITPGPIGINSATYVGYLQYGVWGAVTATFGLVLPSIFLIPLMSKMLKSWHEKWWMKGFLAGMRPAALGLMLVALVVFAELSILPGKLPFRADAGDFMVNWGALGIMLGAVACGIFTKIKMTWLVLIAAAAGYFIC